MWAEISTPLLICVFLFSLLKLPLADILGEGLKCKLHVLKTVNVISYIPLELADGAGEVVGGGVVYE